MLVPFAEQIWTNCNMYLGEKIMLVEQDTVLLPQFIVD